MASPRLPRIGITIGTVPAWRARTAADYKRAVREAGGWPVLIGQGQEHLLDECQGILFTGGLDIHPGLYPRREEESGLTDDEVIRRFQLEVEERRDAYELPLARGVLERKIPVLGICRGCQTLNVAAGGTLVPDIPRCLPHAIPHKLPGGTQARHPVDIRSGSLLAELIGATCAVVNTYHHQGATEAEIAPGLRVAAQTADGVAEALEMPSHPFFMGVQWHPERRRDTEVAGLCRPLFSALVDAARTG